MLNVPCGHDKFACFDLEGTLIKYKIKTDLDRAAEEMKRRP